MRDAKSPEALAKEGPPLEPQVFSQHLSVANNAVRPVTGKLLDARQRPVGVDAAGVPCASLIEQDDAVLAEELRQPSSQGGGAGRGESWAALEEEHRRGVGACRAGSDLPCEDADLSPFWMRIILRYLEAMAVDRVTMEEGRCHARYLRRGQREVVKNEAYTSQVLPYGDDANWERGPNDDRDTARRNTKRKRSVPEGEHDEFLTAAGSR